MGLFTKKKKGSADVVNIDNLDALKDKKRNLEGTTERILKVICVAMVIFQVYVAGFGQMLANSQRAIHLAFGMVLAFMLYPATKKQSGAKKIPVYDWILALLALSANLYLVIFMSEIQKRAGYMTKADFIFGLILVILLLEASRRVAGPILTTIAAVFLIYVLFGKYFPGQLAHRGASLETMIRHMYTTTEGVYGTILGVSSSFIFLFILMGALMTRMGTGEFLIDIAVCLFGKQRGGPAKAAVFSSALFGTISGSSVANVVTTGTFTIPLMKKIGYRPHFAGSVEAAASVGGQIMPPVMGAAAFIIAENLGMPYIKVCIAAALPAVLYFTGIMFAVHQEAVKMGIEGMDPSEIPDIREVMKRAYLILPLVVIIVALALGFSPAMSGFVAVVTCILLSYVRPESRLTPTRLVEAFVEGTKNALEVLIACAVVGFIVGSFTLSGLGLKLASIVVGIGQGYLLPTLILTAIACIILGMGVPTTANYVMMSMITVPAVVEMGVPAIAAHLFCFYFGIISDLTPPVALGALAGAGLAQAKFWPTALNATKLACAAYVAPFFFVYNPILILGYEPFSIKLIPIVLFTVFGILALSCALYNFLRIEMKLYERLVVFAVAFLCIHPDILGSLIGLALFILVVLNQKRRQRALAAT